jgi:hypothetical protein
MGTRRFERLERERAEAARPEPEPRVPSVEARFGGEGPPGAGEAPGRSGASESRFEQDARDDRIRVLDVGEGQPFVRCALCRSDSYLTATRCAQCDALLETPEQRAFNEALWRKTRAEGEVQEREVAALRDRRAQGDREQADAHRRRALIEAELDRRRALGLPLDDRDAVGDPARAAARWLGRFLGSVVARWLPSRRARVGAAAALGLGYVALCFRFPVLVWATVWVVIVLTALFQHRRWRG